MPQRQRWAMLRCRLVRTLARASSHRLGGSGSGPGGPMPLPPKHPPSSHSPWVPLGLGPKSKPSAGANGTQGWVSRNAPPSGLCPSRAAPAHANPLPGLCPRSSPGDRQGFSRPAKEGHKRLAQGLGLWENGTALPVPAAPPCQGCQRSQGRFWCPSTPSHPHGRVHAQPGHPRGS